MKKVNEVLMTNNYDLFTLLSENRNVSILHKNRLKNSIQKKYLQSPIIVNDKYEIIDGQHRYTAAKELQLPIYFIVVDGYNIDDVKLLNTNMKNWTSIDYLNTYCDLGHPTYIKFRDFMMNFPDFGFQACMVLLADPVGRETIQDKTGEITGIKKSWYKPKSFEEGELRINDLRTSKKNAENILSIKPYYDGFYRGVFVRAMVAIFKLDEYDHVKMLTKLKNNPTALQHCANTSQYRLMLEDIYNFRSRIKISLRY